MKHILGIAIWVTGVLILVVYLIYPLFPKKIHVDVQGVKYRLGSPSIEKPVQVQVNGEIDTTFLGKRTFEGEIEIEGEVNPISKESKYTLQLSELDYSGMIMYHYPYRDEAGDQHAGSFMYGLLNQQNDFQQGAIQVNQQKEEGASAWSGENGYVIAYPANDRAEALALTNEILLPQYREYDSSFPALQ
ncbi:hypothetical protein ACFQ3J_12615 [Paenibacillus provencensis]|uniref:DUF4131 domain-containing protein n=1 Tax=Paenibacillus provencensis TaxID=441151 RepID=A0ABW3PY49_9BACL|nr:hypothetical protein [Paenibacillus sp. MER 78]MCM3127483.1 hypothetical protein [Paenibacillus sp. MER 78]